MFFKVDCVKYINLIFTSDEYLKIFHIFIPLLPAPPHPPPQPHTLEINIGL